MWPNITEELWSMYFLAVFMYSVYKRHFWSQRVCAYIEDINGGSVALHMLYGTGYATYHTHTHTHTNKGRGN